MKSPEFNVVLKYFLRGLLFVVPISLTIYIIWISIEWLDNLIPFSIPGLGLLMILLIITFFGFIGSTILAKPLIDLLESFVVRLPLVNIIYSSIKDLISAFVGDKKKFNQAVLVALDADQNIKKLGFITQEDLSILNLPGMVAVYLPHSYNFSGNLFIVPKDYVIPIEGSSGDIMKFIVSGGVSGLPKPEAEGKFVE